MKRRDLLKRIDQAAKAANVDNDVVREGGEHSIYQCGGTKYSVPRHREISERTAEGILKTLQVELGEGWWKK